MELIKISLPEISNAANSIRTYNNSIADVLNNTHQQMNSLNNVWKSEGSETLIRSFERFAAKFKDVSQIIESYAAFLDNVVANYDSLESTIVSNASNFN